METLLAFARHRLAMMAECALLHPCRFQAMSEEEQQKLVAGMQQAEWMEER